MFICLDPMGVETSGCRSQRQEYATAADESLVNIDADAIFIHLAIDAVLFVQRASYSNTAINLSFGQAPGQYNGFNILLLFACIGCNCCAEVCD
jgi:hypothetical protein